MQKVEGSSPFSRFEKGPQKRAFCVLGAVEELRVSRNRVPNADVQHGEARLDRVRASGL
jgi:hypothetical protein